MDMEYFNLYKELRASGLTPNQAILKAHELIAFGE
jgi:hypothetical protein